MDRFLSNIVSWLRTGYPNGVPRNDYLPILALLARRLTTDEVVAIARQLLPPPGEIGNDVWDDVRVDIGVAITKITDQLPAPVDVDRVRAKLAAYGWPLDDPREPDQH